MFLNMVQGQRHPSAERQLRTDKPDHSGPHNPHPRRAASEGYAIFPRLTCFIMTARFRCAQSSQWQPLLDGADCAVYLCLSSGPSLSPPFLFTLSPSLSHWVSNGFFFLFWKTYKELQQILQLERTLKRWILGRPLFNDEPSVCHFCSVSTFTPSPHFPTDLSSCTSAWAPQFWAQGRGLSLQLIRLLIGWGGWGCGGGTIKHFHRKPGLTAPTPSSCCWQR